MTRPSSRRRRAHLLIGVVTAPRRLVTRSVAGATCALLASFATPAFAQVGRSDTARAVRLTEPVRMDGRLAEEVWRTAPAVTRFTQREPNEGQPATEPAEVRFAYDDDALYVGARMYARDPSAIRALVTRRDQEGHNEFIAVSLDTYQDRRTAYSFGVTPSGVRIDVFHPTDNDHSDSGFDPVWEAKAVIDSAGWTAEFRIPFNQLRFLARDEQVWGLNVIRRIPARNEDTYWRLIRRAETGWSSRMGTLVGIRGIAPSHRIEALPYVAGGSRIRDDVDPANPFQHRADTEARVGGDLKVGLGPNLTLDVTLNPDFGQVEGDPAVVNLSAFEVFFDEKRPFFTEGADLLDRRGLFYSRRIGSPPPGDADADFAEERSNSTILGAAKLTGRLPSKLSIAGLAALTDREIVRTFDAATSAFGHAEIAPRTLYGAFSAQQEFGRDASTLAGMVTLVTRDMDAGSSLATLLPRTAVSGLIEGRYRWSEGMYDINSWFGGTGLRGDSLAITRLQRSSRRYWQRPDRFRLDSSRSTLAGSLFGIGHSKVAGKHWLWDLDYSHDTPGFEPNDIGAKGNVDNRTLSGRLVWRETEPAGWYRSYSTGVRSERGWSYDWLKRFSNAAGFFEVEWPNYWETEVNLYRFFPSFSDRLTRGGPVMATAGGGGMSFSLESNRSRPNNFDLEAGIARDDAGGFEHAGEAGFSLRPGPQTEIHFDPEWVKSRDTRQFVARVPGGTTFGNRYVFAAVDVSEVSARLRVNYAFTPNLSLETYAEPFAASGRFHSFGELPAARAMALRMYGADGTTIIRNPDGSHTVTDGAASFDIEPLDFNVRSFRTNAVVRWEWRPGSTMFLVWQQDRGGDRPYRPARPGDLFDALDTRGDNFLAVKISYWLALD